MDRSGDESPLFRHKMDKQAGSGIANFCHAALPWRNQPLGGNDEFSPCDPFNT